MTLVPYVSFGKPFTSNVYMLTQVQVPLYNWQKDTMNWYIYIWYAQSCSNFFYSNFGARILMFFWKMVFSILDFLFGDFLALCRFN